MSQGLGLGPADAACWPRYCCAILRNEHGLYLLERRAADDPDVPGQSVCFGGGREAGEHPDDCIRRELREELGWEAAQLTLCVRLLHPPREAPPVHRTRPDVAWFYRGVVHSATPFRTEPGVEAVWLAAKNLRTHPIGDWNLAALLAEQRGDPIAWTES